MSLDRGWRTVVCVASGPSLTVEQCDLIAAAQRAGRCRVIVVNNNWERLPGADVLYAADGMWWGKYLPAVRARFTGELWTQDRGKLDGEPWEVVARRWGLHVVRSEPGAGAHVDAETVYQHANGGAQAVCLARLFGARRIILAGYDMQRTAGAMHWHGPHPEPLANGNPKDWIRHFDTLAGALKADGVRVVNCARETSLACFDRADLAETLA